MPEFLQYGFMHRAFAAGVVTALICPAIGVFLIPRRLSLIADTLAHVALAGVALGLVLGVSPVLGALVVALAGAVVTVAIRGVYKHLLDDTLHEVLSRTIAQES